MINVSNAATNVTGVRSETSNASERILPDRNFVPTLPRDVFRPGPVLTKPIDPHTFDGLMYGRMGKEDLAAAKAKAEAKQKDALSHLPPDLKAYVDAQKTIDAIEKEQGKRALESASYKFGLSFKSDAQLQAELAKAEKELDAVNSNPFASEADREQAREHVQAVLAEQDRRD